MYSKYQARCWNVFEKTSCLKNSGIPLAENKAKCQIYQNLRETFVHRIWEGSSTKSRTLDCLPSFYFRPLPGTFPKPCWELSWNPAHDLPRTFPEPCKTQPEIFPPNSRAITIGTSPTHVCAPQLLERRNQRSLELQKRHKVNGMIAKSAVHHSHFSTNLQAWTEATLTDISTYTGCDFQEFHKIRTVHFVPPMRLKYVFPQLIPERCPEPARNLPPSHPEA